MAEVWALTINAVKVNIRLVNNLLEKLLAEEQIYVERLFPYQEAGKIQLIREYGQLISEEYTEAGQYSNVMSYVNKYYPEIVNTANLYERLGIYDIVYFLAQLVKHPELDELKNDVLSAAKIVTSKDEKINRKI